MSWIHLPLPRGIQWSRLRMGKLMLTSRRLPNGRLTLLLKEMAGQKLLGRTMLVMYLMRYVNFWPPEDSAMSRCLLPSELKDPRPLTLCRF